MTDPIWLSPLSHEVPWAGREPLPEAPRLWLAPDDRVWVEDPSEPPSESARARWRSAGWIEVERPRVESGRTEGHARG